MENEEIRHFYEEYRLLLLEKLNLDQYKSLSEFERLTGVSRTLIGKLISGKIYTLSIRNIYRIADYMNIPPSDLLYFPQLGNFPFDLEDEWNKKHKKKRRAKKKLKQE